MVLRLPPDQRQELLDSEGAQPFEPMPGRALREYVVPPQSVIANRAELHQWMGKAFECALSLPKASKRAPRLVHA